MAYEGKQYANLSAGAWRIERLGVEDSAKLSAFLVRHAKESHSLLEWDRMWSNFIGLTPTVRLTWYRQQLAAQGHCMANRDGDCDWEECPQLRDDEPHRSGRHCPRDNRCEDEG